jgi:hypothetical protein
MAEHNPQHGRRPHFHRGRRGPDRRGTDRRNIPRDHAPDAGRETAREGGIDVEQIMRDIRSRIAQRHGIELSTQQIQELAARRLEAILEPRNVKPQLLEQLRKSASATEVPAAKPIETYQFDEETLYETHRGILRFFRRVLNPILKLFFNPTPLVHALNTQARINKELAARELEREQRQSEWNALNYELIQRMVLETSRVSFEMQALANKIESLSAKLDFNERRVRSLETIPTGAPRPRHQEAPATPTPPAAVEVGVTEAAAPSEGTGEGTRRRRRRRRGRRSGGGPGESPAAAETPAVMEDEGEPEDGEDEELTAELSAAPAPESRLETTPAESPVEPPIESPVEAPVEASVDTALEPATPPVPTPPADEPRPQDPVDRADPGPVDR